MPSASVSKLYSITTGVMCECTHMSVQVMVMTSWPSLHVTHLHEFWTRSGVQLGKGPHGDSYMLGTVVIHSPHHIISHATQQGRSCNIGETECPSCFYNWQHEQQPILTWPGPSIAWSTVIKVASCSPQQAASCNGIANCDKHCMYCMN